MLILQPVQPKQKRASLVLYMLTREQNMRAVYLIRCIRSNAPRHAVTRSPGPIRRTSFTFTERRLQEEGDSFSTLLDDLARSVRGCLPKMQAPPGPSLAGAREAQVDFPRDPPRARSPLRLHLDAPSRQSVVGAQPGVAAHDRRVRENRRNVGRDDSAASCLRR